MNTALILVLILGYLLVIYVGFYHFIGYKSLKSPYIKNSFILDSRKEFSITENPLSLKYVALGDSLTAGVGSDTVVDTYVYRFAQKLAQKHSEVEVSNFGIPGARTDEVITMQLQKAIEAKPNVITLLIGVNDIHNKKSTVNFKTNYEFIVDTLLASTDAKINLLTIPYIGSRYLVLPPFSQYMEFRTKKFNSVIYEVALRDTGRIKVFDLYSTTLKHAKNDDKYYSSDLYHPSGYGYNLWGQFLNDD